MSKGKKSNSTLYVVIIIGCLILGGFYYLTEKNKQRSEGAKESVEDYKYDECIDSTYRLYYVNWNTACESRGLSKDCQLTVTTASRLEEERIRQEDRCFDLYKK